LKPVLAALRVASYIALCTTLLSCSSTLVGRGGTALSFEALMQGRGPDQPLAYAEFTPAAAAAAPHNRFSGRLVLNPQGQSVNFRLLVDEFDLSGSGRPGMDELPRISAAFVQDRDLLIPLEQGPIDTGHNWWDIVWRPGRVWDEPGDNGFSRAAIPFALKERGEDCTHNGMLTFVFRDPEQISAVAFQVGNQTCRYLQFEMWGTVSAQYLAQELPGSARSVAAVRANLASRLPVKSIEDIALDYPGADAREFGSAEEIDPADMSAYGFLIDGVHYGGGCATPRGPYPYCDEMALPSYSTAKSLVGGLGLMLMESLYPGTATASIGALVPECGATWDDVTIEHALDMTTGHYLSPEMHVDEDVAVNSRFFRAKTHARKIDYACTAYPRQSAPGELLTYHSWDTYLAGTAMQNRLRSLAGPDADFYDDLVVPRLWQPLGLSQLARSTRRTEDAVAQPFTAFGLTFVRDDVARLLEFLGPADGRIDGEEVLYRPLFDAVKQRVAGDRGMVAEFAAIRYNNGFRSFDVASYIGCRAPVWVLTLSGFGGINFVVMPNATAYYYFSDGNVHRYLHAVRESHKIRPMCDNA
jgi:hypothetical protein